MHVSLCYFSTCTPSFKFVLILVWQLRIAWIDFIFSVNLFASFFWFYFTKFLCGPDIDLGESFECADKMENELSGEAELTSSHGAHTLPILQKVIDLGNKIKV